MTRSSSVRILGLLVGMLVAAAAEQSSGAPLRIMFTAETRGNLEPCDCPGLPLGGLARRAAFMAQALDEGIPVARHSSRHGNAIVNGAAADAGHPEDGRPHLLRLDLGGFLPEGQVPLADRPGVARRYLAILLEGLDAAGIDAGVLDHGMRSFLQDAVPSAFAPLADRLLDADPPGPPLLIDWNGSAVALLTLQEDLPDSIVVAAARSAWEAAGPGGYLFVLGRADGFSGRRLARLTRADLVLLSRGARFPRPLTEGRSLLVACGAHGREVGDLLVAPAATQAPGDALAIRAPGGRVQVLDWSLRPMDDTVPEDPHLAREAGALMRDAGPALDQVLQVATE